MSVYLSNWLMFYPMAFSLFVVLRLAQASTDSRHNSIGVLVVRSMIVILFLFALLSVGARYSPLSIMWLMIAVVFSLILYFKQLRLNRSAITMTLLSCRDLSQIQRAAGLFHEEHGGWLGRRLNKFRQQLAQGIEPAAALETAGFTQSAYERLSARLVNLYGSENGSNQELFGLLRVEMEYERLLGRLAILGWCLLVAPVLILFQAVIVPTLLRMLEEFEQPVPWMLSLVGSQSAFGLIISVGIPLLLIGVFSVAFMLWMFPALAQQQPLRWFCGAYFRSLGFIAFARVAQHTADAITALQDTSRLLPVPYLAKKFEFAATRVEQGKSVADALINADLISQKRIGDFAAHLDTTGLAWATEQMAAGDVARMLNRYSIWIQWTLVCVTLIFAVFVALVSIGLMEALTQMVCSLA